MYDDSGATLLLMPRNDILVKIHLWLAMIAPAQLPFKSEIIDNTISYNPQRVLRQLGYDQKANMVTGEMGNSNILTAKSRFAGDVKEKNFNQFQENIMSKQSNDGSEVPRWFVVLENCLSKILAFVTSKDEDNVKVPPKLSISKKDRLG